MRHSVAQFDQLDKESKSSIIELCIRAIGQHLTRVSDSSQVGAMVVAAQSIKADGQHILWESMIIARAKLLKDVKNHGTARLRACDSVSLTTVLAASALVVFFFVFFVLGIFVPVRHASQCSVVGLTQK